ncbi:MAG: hypothetical protein OEV42_04405 [Deltaproteobacteria bacterium]|nr:hypothetical protein [Deltaproteobacteria bacterium]
MKSVSISLILFILLTNLVIADEPDFLIHFEDCKMTLGYLVLSDKSLIVSDADPVLMTCNRKSDKFTCSFQFTTAQKKSRSNEYNIILDSPPLLHIATSTGSEYIAINTAQHAAVIENRILDEKFLGTKICQGMYVTNFEMKSLGKK